MIYNKAHVLKKYTAHYRLYLLAYNSELGPSFSSIEWLNISQFYPNLNWSSKPDCVKQSSLPLLQADRGGMTNNWKRKSLWIHLPILHSTKRMLPTHKVFLLEDMFRVTGCGWLVGRWLSLHFHVYGLHALNLQYPLKDCPYFHIILCNLILFWWWLYPPSQGIRAY